MEGIHLNKEETIEMLMDEYGDSVVRLAFTFVKKEQLAEDIAQEVFIKCYQNLDTFRYESSYKTWIYRITVNLCKDKLSSWSFRKIFPSDFFSENKINFNSPESELLKLEARIDLSTKILSLPIIYREVIILYYFEELPYSQITDLLNISTNTIKSRLHKGRILLKKLISEGGNN